MENGAKRIDTDRDGYYDDSEAIALFDAWYNEIINATLSQIVEIENYKGENVSLTVRDNAPNPGGSAYMDGYYGYMKRIFDMSLNQSNNPYKELKCANSDDIKDCKNALVESLELTLKKLGGITNKSNFNKDKHIEKSEAIQFIPLGLSGVPDIYWVNRPTFQQLVEPASHR